MPSRPGGHEQHRRTAAPRLRAEVWIVLGLSLGQSAVYAVVQLLDKLTRAPLSQGTSTLNRRRAAAATST